MEMPRRIESQPRFAEPPMAVAFEVRREDYETASTMQDASALLEKRDRVVDVLYNMGHQDCIEGLRSERSGGDGPEVDRQTALARNGNGLRIDVLAHHIPPEVAHLLKPRTVPTADFEEPSRFDVVQIFPQPSVMLIGNGAVHSGSPKDHSGDLCKTCPRTESTPIGNTRRGVRVVPIIGHSDVRFDWSGIEPNQPADRGRASEEAPCPTGDPKAVRQPFVNRLTGGPTQVAIEAALSPHSFAHAAPPSCAA